MGIRRFLGILAGVEERSNSQGKWAKNQRSGKARFGDGFGTFLMHFFRIFKAQNTVNIQCFCNCGLRQQREMLQEHYKYQCFWRAMCRKHCKYCGFWRNVQKTSCVSQSIGTYAVFWPLSAENCVNSLVLELVWTSGKQKLLVFTGFCERNAWKTLVLQCFHAFFLVTFSMCWINWRVFHVDKTLPPRARRLCSYTSLSLILLPWRHRRCAKPVNTVLQDDVYF